MPNDMRKIVEEGYDKGAYAASFRTPEAIPRIAWRFVARFAECVSGEGCILDLGCGTGEPFDRFLSGRGFAVTGIDISGAQIDLAQRGVPAATFAKADFTQVQFAESSFNGVACLYALFHIPRAEHAGLLKKISRWLKPGGVFVASLGTRDAEYEEEENWFGARMAWSSFSHATYREMILREGFEIVEEDYEGAPSDAEHHYWVLARKTPFGK